MVGLMPECRARYDDLATFASVKGKKKKKKKKDKWEKYVRLRQIDP
jgi:hypothetical protein